MDRDAILDLIKNEPTLLAEFIGYIQSPKYFTQLRKLGNFKSAQILIKINNGKIKSNTLTCAIHSNNTKLVKLLIENGADTSEVVCNLHAPIRRGNIEMLKFIYLKKS